MLLGLAWQGHASDNVIRLYHDADRSVHTESAISIERGIRTALSEVNNEVQGYKIELVTQDHRGNVIRSKRNFERFINDDKALVIYSGIHSPPLIKNRDYINNNKALTLVPWAAGGGITRFPSKENWIFRLSLDDTQVGAVLADFAVRKKQCKSPHLLLENTPWGDSNLRTLTRTLEREGFSNIGVSRFDISLKKGGAGYVLKKIKRAGGDCIILVANAIEGVNIARAMASLPIEGRMPIISHWGITGGHFHEDVDYVMRQKLDLFFIQSCFSFNSLTLSPLGQHVFEVAKGLFPGDIKDSKDIVSPVGFVHAYDVTKLLLAAIGNVDLTGDMALDRDAVRLALEAIDMPVAGLVKTYSKPFGVYDAVDNPNAHEALSAKHYCMAEYGKDNEILVIAN